MESGWHSDGDEQEVTLVDEVGLVGSEHTVVAAHTVVAVLFNTRTTTAT